MSGTWRSVAGLPLWVRALLAGQFINAAGALAWVYLTLYLVQSRHLGAGDAGLLTGVNGVGVIGGNFIAGWVGDRLGSRRTLIGGLIGWAVCCALVPVTPVAALAPLLLVAGTLGGFARPLMIAVVLGALPNEQRRVAASLWRVAFNAGAIVGPPLGALAASWNFGIVFVIDGVSSLVLAAAVMHWVPHTPPLPRVKDGPRPESVARTLLTRPLALSILLTVVIVDSSYRQLYVGLPLQLRHIHAPTVVYGFTITANCVLIVLGEVWVAVRMSSQSPRRVISLGYALTGVSWLLFGLMPGVIGAFVLVAVISVGEMLYKPTATAAVADAAPAGYDARYQSLYAGASVAGTVIAPPIGGALIGHAEVLWILCGVLPIACALVLARADSSRGRA